MRTILIAAALSVGALCTLQTEPVAAANARSGPKIHGNAERGRDVVGTWCIGCHRTGAAVDDRAPSLAELAGNPKHTDGVVRAFLMQPHKPMPPLELSTQQIEDIIVYLRTLKPESGRNR